MFRNRDKHSCLASTRVGSSTLEFILCAPVLVMVLYIAMEINERIEQQVTTAIAGSNAAWLADVNAASVNGLQDIAKADALGASVDQGGVRSVGIAPSDLIDGSDSVLSLSDEKHRLSNYEIYMDRQVGDMKSAVGDDFEKRSKGNIGGGKIDSMAGSLNAKLNWLVSTVEAATNVNLDFIPNFYLFPPTKIERQSLSWNLKGAGSNNLALVSIKNISEFIDGNNQDNANNLNQINGLLAHQISFLKRDPKYLPDDYKHQAAFGMVVGYFESGFGEFNDNCFMKFGRILCQVPNRFYYRVQAAHTTVQRIKTAFMCNPTPWAVVAKGVVKGIKSALIQAAKDAARDAVKEKIEAEIGNKIRDQVKAVCERMSNEANSDCVSNLFTDITQTISDEMRDVMKEVGGE